ncbi:MAG: helix-turn-helix domain-containing protein [Candidatus Magasanikbacteria bacterium]|uniref:HTH cro/C1-type domain-containing protein n=1 Tax=Candidatus Magasanikbacteria bacterium CG10_big_fil_rev_8_21_14_0_10_38_6 TaxID=1974647 RepID=A0A2M6NZH5_9BACT|nr:helix-turn-helix domain-containing protein [Candidatus Magasanikbacteria bacterium]NCS71649.1 helix-turn-helix domain-containing protein [Candidatus Magasanikbacteria bacterium]PIR76875.1 MAG: hypothetical protein COU30_05525 [Candidatus Magasanikbacteria bacterium CG10_big_fil_rev_8_21_14_0_10_38_6]
METSFSQKQLDFPGRVCARLKDAREFRGVTLIELSRRTKISKKHLVAIEACKFDELPFATIYKKHFICSYAKALDLDPEPFLSQYIEEESPISATIPSPSKTLLYSQPTTLHHFFSKLPSLLRITVILIFAGAIVGYLFLQVRHILEPPMLTVYTPEDGFVTEGNSVLIQGRVEKEAELFINGIDIQHKEDGQFRETVPVSTGVNTLLIEAKKKHGRITTDTRHVIVQSNEQFSLVK